MCDNEQAVWNTILLDEYAKMFINAFGGEKIRS